MHRELCIFAAKCFQYSKRNAIINRAKLKCEGKWSGWAVAIFTSNHLQKIQLSLNVYKESRHSVEQGQSDRTTSSTTLDKSFSSKVTAEAISPTQEQQVDKTLQQMEMWEKIPPEVWCYVRVHFYWSVDFPSKHIVSKSGEFGGRKTSGGNRSHFSLNFWTQTSVEVFLLSPRNFSESAR